jgi:hypothetical protein
MDVVKVDRYVAIFVHVCCKLLSPIFHLCFGRMLQVCLSICCICFTHILHVFYLDIAYVCNGFQVFLYVCFCKCFKRHVSSVSTVFRRMLQLLHLDVSKVDQMLCTEWAWETVWSTSERRGPRMSARKHRRRHSRAGASAGHRVQARMHET